MKDGFYRNIPQRIVYALFFAIFMGIDWVVGSKSQFIWLITNNFSGIVIAFLCFTAYGMREFKKPFYVLYSIAGVVAYVLCYRYYWTHQVGHIMAFWVTVPLNVWFLGMAALKLIEKVFVKREESLSFQKWEIFFVICILCMVFSRSDYIWPVYYLIAFEILFHTPFSEKKKRDLFRGMLDGIVLGFFVLQMFAYLLVPYVSVRYEGIYGDCNRNSCMYLIVLAAVLSRDYIYRIQMQDHETGKMKSAVMINRIFSAVLIGFIFFTGCRTALLTAFVMLGVYLCLAERKVFRLDFLHMIGKTGIFCVLTVCSVFFVYLSIRYVPVLGDHAKYFISGFMESKAEIRTLVEKDSYISFEEAMDGLLGRIRFFSSSGKTSKEREGQSLFTLRVYAANSDSFENDQKILIRYVREDSEGQETYGEFYLPDFLNTHVESENIRIYIYTTYLHNLNLTGHTIKEGFFYIKASGSDEVYISQNAQNVLMYLLFSYGIPIGGFAFILLLYATVRIFYLCVKGRKDCLVYLLFYTVFWVMGFQEVVWIPGQIVLFMIFWGLFFVQDRETKYL